MTDIEKDKIARPTTDASEFSLPYWLKFYVGLTVVASFLLGAYGVGEHAWWACIAGVACLLGTPWLLGFADLVHSARVIAKRTT